MVARPIAKAHGNGKLGKHCASICTMMGRTLARGLGLGLQAVLGGAP
jgi:hypothetical protein